MVEGKKDKRVRLSSGVRMTLQCLLLGCASIVQMG